MTALRKKSAHEKGPDLLASKLNMTDLKTNYKRRYGNSL